MKITHLLNTPKYLLNQCKEIIRNTIYKISRIAKTIFSQTKSLCTNLIPSTFATRRITHKNPPLTRVDPLIPPQEPPLQEIIAPTPTTPNTPTEEPVPEIKTPTNDITIDPLSTNTPATFPNDPSDDFTQNNISSLFYKIIQWPLAYPLGVIAATLPLAAVYLLNKETNPEMPNSKNSISKETLTIQEPTKNEIATPPTPTENSAPNPDQDTSHPTNDTPPPPETPPPTSEESPFSNSTQTPHPAHETAPPPAFGETSFSSPTQHTPHPETPPSTTESPPHPTQNTPHPANNTPSPQTETSPPDPIHNASPSLSHQIIQSHLTLATIGTLSLASFRSFMKKATPNNTNSTSNANTPKEAPPSKPSTENPSNPQYPATEILPSQNQTILASPEESANQSPNLSTTKPLPEATPPLSSTVEELANIETATPSITILPPKERPTAPNLPTKTSPSQNPTMLASSMKSTNQSPNLSTTKPLPETTSSPSSTIEEPANIKIVASQVTILPPKEKSAAPALPTVKDTELDDIKPSEFDEMIQHFLTRHRSKEWKKEQIAKYCKEQHPHLSQIWKDPRYRQEIQNLLNAHLEELNETHLSKKWKEERFLRTLATLGICHAQARDLSLPEFAVTALRKGPKTKPWQTVPEVPSAATAQKLLQTGLALARKGIRF